jgi:hypothetical protein
VNIPNYIGRHITYAVKGFTTFRGWSTQALLDLRQYRRLWVCIAEDVHGIIECAFRQSPRFGAVPRGFQPDRRVGWLSLGSEMEASHQVLQADRLHAVEPI